jgi:AcrR family transcriptional regulator
MEIPDLKNLNLQEKEERILKAAISIFSEKGYSAATTSEIAKSAGVAEGTIFRYFKTKKDILRGILIQLLNLLSGKMVMEGVEKIIRESEGKDPRIILKELLYDRMQLLDSVYPMAKVVLAEAIHHEDVRNAVYENIIVRAIKVFEEFHKKMSDKGLLRQDISTEAMLRCILGNLAGFIAQRKLFPDKLPVQDMEKELDMVIDVVMFGISPVSQQSRTAPEVIT